MEKLKRTLGLVTAILCIALVPQFAWAASNAVQADATGGAEQEALESGDNVYVDGSKGNDANPGTEDAPVKTFARAKQLMDEHASDIVWVTGTLQVSGTVESWDLGGKTLMRESGFTGELVHVSNGASLTLKNIVIDGGSLNGAKGKVSLGDGSGGSLVGVFGDKDAKSSLRIEEGAKLQNNYILSSGHWMPESGGGVYCSDGIVDVDGGVIADNKAVYGGGICAVYDSVVNVLDGSITGNEALGGQISGMRGYSGTGGGICAWRGAAVNLSGGSIDGNAAYNRGGGISMGGFQTFEGDSGSVLTMTGGSISNNTAGSSGGGIFVQAGLSEDANDGVATYCIAKISGGKLVGNSMTNKGDGNSEFGGGAIYVNGYSSQYNSFHNGELYLENVKITGNRAAIAGGGYAACPASHTEVKLTNGSVFYGNNTDKGSAREIYILASSAYGTHSGNPSYEITPSMLGGGAYRWTYDDGSEVPLDELSGELDAASMEELSLGNALTSDDKDVQKAVSLSKVDISGNESATRGGAIGSNGSVFIGTESETTEIEAAKQWKDANNKDGIRPESVIFELYRDGEYVGYQSVLPDTNGSWSTTFKNLPKADANGKGCTYTIKERDIEGYTATVLGNSADGFVVTNTRSTSVSVTKKWNDNDNADGKRPISITVDLLRDGEKVDSAVIRAGEDGNWSHTFDGIPKYDESNGREYVYTVREADVEGYMAEVEASVGNGFTITNTRKPSTPPDTSTTPSTPKTPDSSSEWPHRGLPPTGDAAVSAASPLALAALSIAIGFVLRKRIGGR